MFFDYYLKKSLSSVTEPKVARSYDKFLRRQNPTIKTILFFHEFEM